MNQVNQPQKYFSFSSVNSNLARPPDPQLTLLTSGRGGLAGIELSPKSFHILFQWSTCQEDKNKLCVVWTPENATLQCGSQVEVSAQGK